MKPAPGPSSRGFTLIELLVTLAIIAAVTTMAVGSYRQYIRRAGRVDATSALLRLAAAQEKFYLQNGRYANEAERPRVPPEGLGLERTERGYYLLNVEPGAGGMAVGYTASATVDPDSAQADDEDCWVFRVNERGLRAAETSGGATGAAVTDACWR